MFGATLKYFNLFVHPNPKFSIPISELEPVYHIRRRAPETDVSCVSNNSLSGSRATDFASPKKFAIDFASSRILDAEARARRRNTFCQIDADKAFLHNDSNEMPLQFFDSFDFETSPDRISESSSSRNPRTRVRIVAPSDSPNRSFANRKLSHDIAALYSSSGTQESKIARNINNQNRCGPSAKGKEKRVSAPPILAVYRDEGQTSKGKALQITGTSDLGSPSSGIYALPRSQLIPSPKFIPPTLAHQSQRPPPPQTVPPSSSNAARPFESDLSPIIEDIFAFADPLDMNEDSLVASTADSSTSSYGQLLGEMHVDYFSLSHFGGLEWGNDERSRAIDCPVPLSTQGFGETHDPGWMGDFLETIEEQNLIPELTLTAPTPDIGESPQILSESKSASRPHLFEDGVNPVLRQQRNPETVALKNGTSDLGYPFLDLNSANLDLALGSRGYPGTACRDNSDLGRGNDGFKNRSALGSDDTEKRRASSFRLSMLRVDDTAKENIPPNKTGGVWKRFSRILETVSPSNSRRQSLLGRAQPLSNVNDASCQPSSRLSSRMQGSDSTMPSKRGSGTSIPTVPVCIHEEGEHAALRLFGLPSTGASAKGPKSEAGKATKVEDDEKGRQARRRSFGFNVKGFSNRRRYRGEDAE